jgi:tetratricopeptide (TPR) repeat protein
VPKERLGDGEEQFQLQYMSKRSCTAANTAAAFLLGVLITLGGLGGSAAPTWAGQSDARLDPLFEQLRATTDSRTAAPVEEEIWNIWLDYPSDDVLVLMQDGVSSMNEDDYAGALAAFDAVVAMAPDYAEGWNKRANTHYLRGDYPAAVADIRQVLILEPRHFAALAGLGLIYLELDEADGALKAFNAALAINPHLAAVRERLSELQHRLARSTL